MFESLLVFNKNIEDLISHLQSEKLRTEYLIKNIKLNKISLNEDDVQITQPKALLISKNFTYCNAVISLYGYFESFLEDLVSEYIADINTTCIPYKLLPKKIKDLHLDSSIELIKKTQRDRSINFNHKETLIKSLVNNINSCFNLNNPSKLNERAFSNHSSNFRFETVEKLFNNIGINKISVYAMQKQSLKDSIKSKHSIDYDVDNKILVSLLRQELDDLAQRRNEIAHGNFDRQLESIDIFSDKAIIFKEFGAAISNKLTDSYHQILLSSKILHPLEKAHKCYPTQKVFGFNPSRCNSAFKISNGDMLYAQNLLSNTPLKYGKVVSIIRNKQLVDQIQLPCASEFALKIDFKISNRSYNRDLFIVHEK